LGVAGSAARPFFLKFYFTYGYNIMILSDREFDRLSQKYTRAQITALFQEWRDLQWATYTPKVEARLDELAKELGINVWGGK
jgi:hypothetical protein